MRPPVQWLVVYVSPTVGMSMDRVRGLIGRGGQANVTTDGGYIIALPIRKLTAIEQAETDARYGSVSISRYDAARGPAVHGLGYAVAAEALEL